MGLRKKRVVDPNGNEIDATIMPYQVGAEYWNEYLVDDGTVIKVKFVATELLKFDGLFDPMGEPQYSLQGQAIVSVSAPDKLRKGGTS